MNLETTYLGLPLRNPLVAASSPLSKKVAGIRALEDAGCSAVVLFSLFEEQIIHESESVNHYLEYGSESYAEALTYFPEPDDFHAGPDEYLEIIRQAKAAVQVPIIASLNGISTGGWTRYARLIENAGADALELNVYYIPTDPDVPGAEVELRYLDVVRQVASEVSIPVSVKVGPFFSSTANMVQSFAECGAKGVVLFNRFYEPDFDLANLDVVPSLTLSNSYEMRLPLHWVGLLFGRVHIDFAITSGVHTHYEVLKAMMAGANVVQLASVLLKGGVGRAAEILERLLDWGLENEYESIEQMRGSLSRIRCADPMAFERANYMKELQSFRPDPANLSPR